MSNHYIYTTDSIKADKDLTEKEKEKEDKKKLITDDTYALYDVLSDLKDQIKLLRISNI